MKKMTYSYETRIWLEHIENLWQDQRTFYPSIPEDRYKLPRNINYYYYLDKKTLSRELETLEEILRELRENAIEVTRALDWCHAMTPIGFTDFLTIVPWILTARSKIPLLEGQHRAIRKTYALDECTRHTEIEALQNQRKIFDSQIRHLDESIQAIKFVTSTKK